MTEAGPRPDLPCGDFGIRIARDGTWYHEGTPFTRPALVRLFSTVLRRAENGDYLLQTPVERGRIEVEDAPFVALEMETRGEGQRQVLHFRTNVDDWVTADSAHPIRVATDPETGEPSPYVLVRAGLEARIARAVFYGLVERAEERDGAHGRELGVWSSGCFFPLGEAP
jgi:hypothetical protein